MYRHLAIAVLLFLAALACSSSHHDRDENAPPAAIGWSVPTNDWGTWICSDACACLGPQQFQIHSFTDIHTNDLCGSQFSCTYRCHADCSGTGK